MPPRVDAAPAAGALRRFNLNINGNDVPAAVLPDGRIVLKREPAERACRLLAIQTASESLGGSVMTPAAAMVAADAADPNGMALPYTVFRDTLRHSTLRCIVLECVRLHRPGRKATCVYNKIHGTPKLIVGVPVV
jgi:hypothetical protein